MSDHDRLDDSALAPYTSYDPQPTRAAPGHENWSYAHTVYRFQGAWEVRAAAREAAAAEAAELGALIREIAERSAGLPDEARRSLRPYGEEVEKAQYRLDVLAGSLYADQQVRLEPPRRDPLRHISHLTRAGYGRAVMRAARSALTDAVLDLADQAADLVRETARGRAAGGARRDGAGPLRPRRRPGRRRLPGRRRAPRRAEGRGAGRE
ncbi:hypothetical protein LG943_24735 [Streptomonospora sp. S1-112]|uniref:Uncharacterized protein n=1 Tax=Streptomonospora mangrovi TaxID=2883123 RepID=A0A9X3NQ85_9ACTN|nr:hypothetical protein [Streptomonospora mangrovi]MDA0567503.1 hypothetical protein [Streptomonospora mangrovi]